jgi:hypothetical protein
MEYLWDAEKSVLTKLRQRGPSGPRLEKEAEGPWFLASLGP